MATSDNTYLGEVKISKLLLKFAVPCVLSLLISALYNVVDQIFIGNSPELGYYGNAATSVVFPLTVIAMAVSFALSDGTAAFMSISQGRKDTKNLHHAIGNALLVNFIISITFVILGFAFMDNLLYLFGASGATISLARDYFSIILLFVPAFMAGNVLNSIIRADGAPAFAMAQTLVGAITNIVLDAVFIYGFNWGIKGAALATIIGQILTLAVGLFYFTRSQTFKMHFSSFKLQPQLLLNIIKLGISTFITQIAVVVITLVSNIMLAKYGAASPYGADIPIATMGICTKVYSIILNIAIGIIVGVQPILGYNIGAGKNQRVRETFRLSLTVITILGVMMTALVELFPDPIISLFGVDSTLYLEFARLTFRIFLLGITLTCIIKIISIFFQAVGEPINSAIASLIRDLLCFIPLALILPNFMGVKGVLWAAPIADLIGVVVVVFMVSHFFHRLGNNSELGSHPVMAQQTHPGIIIAISREHGSQGKKIGELVARQLGVPYYYKELTTIVAKESGLEKSYIDKVNSNDGEEITKELYLTTSPAKYAIEAQDQVLKTIAKQGACVIVGRAADYVLRDYPHVLRIFIHAPFNQRVQNIMDMYDDDKETAQRNIKRSDKNRADYYSMISGQKWGNPANYDLCINSAIGKDNAVKTIVALAKTQ